MQEASLFSSPPFLAPLLLVSSELRADFRERVPGIPTSTDKAETLARLSPAHQQAAQQLGFPKERPPFYAEQVHGSDIALITPDSPQLSLGVDALITDTPGLLLGIHVADCGALYLFDQRTKALGLLHSGKKGSEQNITGKTIQAMSAHFGSVPADLIAVLAPCIRPPHYEVDFAQMIRSQALQAGILENHYHDCGLCTASDLSRFYSYRREKGNTGRLLALLGRLPS